MDEKSSLSILKAAAGAIGLGCIGVLLARSLDMPQMSLSKSAPLIPNHSYLPDERNNIEIFHRSASSIVHISSTAIQRGFFSLDRYEVPQGTGTGFIWDKQGHIVTNHHVISNANRITVRTIDQNEYIATLVGTDRDKDLAVLRIAAPPQKLSPLETIDEEQKIYVGQKALAIGNPFGLDHTLTVGVVSALGREMTSLNGSKILDVIQTDAAINPGNSGGPLLNSQGRLIGVNTQIMSQSGSSAGIGFAIPSQVVNYVVPQLIEFGQVRRVGIRGLTLLDPRIAFRFFGITRGAVIRDVQQDSSGDRAGLRGLKTNGFNRYLLGDVIVELDRQPVLSHISLLNLFTNRRHGDTVRLTLIRAGKKIQRDVELQFLK